jgi:hypothetical protein
VNTLLNNYGEYYKLFVTETKGLYMNSRCKTGPDIEVPWYWEFVGGFLAKWVVVP